MSSTPMIIEFSKATQNVCLCLGLSVIFIVLFMVMPFHSFILSSIGKFIIIVLLGYTLYYNTLQTNKFANNFNIYLWKDTRQWNPLKTNILSSYIFSAFLVVLIVSLFHKFR
jgi:hypothetical protein